MSMAIKYAMQKRAQKMASGGRCETHGQSMCEMCHGGRMAEGGFVEHEESSGYEKMPEVEAHEEDGDLVARIMRQRRPSFSEGGRVANRTDDHADFEDNQFDDLVKRDDLESTYTGENSGDMIGDQRLDEDDQDLVSRIMRSRKMKDRLPRDL